MDNFHPAAVSFTDDLDLTQPSRQALLHHETADLAAVILQLHKIGAADWPVYTIADQSGVWITPKGGISVSGFAAVLVALGNGWTLEAEPQDS